MVEKIKERRFIRVICALLVSSCLLLAPTAHADSFKRTASGWVNPTNVDPNDNGSRISIITTYGKGKFGTSVSNSTVEVERFDPTNLMFCSLSPNILKLPLLARSTVTRFANGDLLFATLDLDPFLDSNLCVDFANDTIASEVHMVVTGGTGKFAGATGTLLIKSNATQLHFEGGLNIHSGITEITEGEIFLSH